MNYVTPHPPPLPPSPVCVCVYLGCSWPSVCCNGDSPILQDKRLAFFSVEVKGERPREPQPSRELSAAGKLLKSVVVCGREKTHHLLHAVLAVSESGHSL